MYSTTSVCEAQNNGGRFVSYPRQGHFYRVIRRIRKPKQKVLVLIDHERLRKIALQRQPRHDSMLRKYKLVFFVPRTDTQKVLRALFDSAPEALGASDNM